MPAEAPPYEAKLMESYFAELDSVRCKIDAWTLGAPVDRAALQARVEAVLAESGELVARPRLRLLPGGRDDA